LKNAIQFLIEIVDFVGLQLHPLRPVPVQLAEVNPACQILFTNLAVFPQQTRELNKGVAIGVGCPFIKFVGD
jgi:hypothetical protein